MAKNKTKMQKIGQFFCYWTKKNVITLLGKVNGHVINCFEAEESNDICFDFWQFFQPLISKNHVEEESFQGIKNWTFYGEKKIQIFKNEPKKYITSPTYPRRLLGYLKNQNHWRL